MTISSHPSRWRLLLMAVVGVLLLAGCGGESGQTGGGGAGKRPPVAKIAFEPGQGAQEASPTAPVRVSVQQGKLDEVELTNGDDENVKGNLAPDGRSWSASEPLGYDKTYTWSGTAIGADGKQVQVQGEFHTVKPRETVRATVNPTDNAQVGVGMPVSVKFDAPVRDKKAAQRALQVQTSVPTEGAWSWLNDRQVDWRPKEYWKPNTRVTVRANLYGVPYGGGNWGKSDVSSTFDIGRSQVVKANVPSHQIQVIRDGQQVAAYQASFGKDGDPNSATPNGTFIVMEKKPVTFMTNQEAGYFNVPENWAARLSNHGEFIHENKANSANIGERNTSHGCINLNVGDAKAYFDSAMLGDPVEVTGSSANLPPKFDVYDWQIPWDQWTAKSAT